MLFVAADQIKEEVVEMKVAGGELRTKQVLGQNSSLMVAARSGGYHSEPHAHDCEQLNYVQSGEIWVFIEDTVYHLQAGDFLRIPPGAVHWAWNRADITCELIEMHTPGLALEGIDAPRLVADGETFCDSAPSRWCDKSYWDNEAAALAAHGVTR
jgi:quercetin dioxygenase-like cupin family protein